MKTTPIQEAKLIKLLDSSFIETWATRLVSRLSPDEKDELETFIDDLLDSADLSDALEDEIREFAGDIGLELPLEFSIIESNPKITGEILEGTSRVDYFVIDVGSGTVKDADTIVGFEPKKYHIILENAVLAGPLNFTQDGDNTILDAAGIHLTIVGTTVDEVRKGFFFQTTGGPFGGVAILEGTSADENLTGTGNVADYYLWDQATVTGQDTAFLFNRNLDYIVIENATTAPVLQIAGSGFETLIQLGDGDTIFVDEEIQFVQAKLIVTPGEFVL